MSAPLEPIVKHDVRLDILCYLADGESLTVQRLSAKTGRNERYVSHHIKLLESFRLASKEGSVEGGQALYVACFDDHPEWVAEAVRDHRRVG